MENIKVWNYCYYVEFEQVDFLGEKEFRIISTHITKNCYLGFIDEKNTEIKIPSWNLTFYYDDCPIKTNLTIDYNNKAKTSGYLMYDYFTIDEQNGYEEFLKDTIRTLTSKWLRSGVIKRSEE